MGKFNIFLMSKEEVFAFALLFGLLIGIVYADLHALTSIRKEVMYMVSIKFLLWLQYNKGFYHKDALDIVKRFNKNKETDLDKSLLYEYLNKDLKVKDGEVT